LALYFWGELVWQRVCATARLFLEAQPARDMVGLTGVLIHECLEVMLPFGLVAVVLAILGNWVQTGPLFTLEPLRPQLDRIHPMKGFQKLFTKRVLFEAIKGLLKLALLGSAAYLFFAATWRQMLTLGEAGAAGQLLALSHWGVALIERLAVALLVIAILDVAFVRWQNATSRIAITSSATASRSIRATPQCESASSCPAAPASPRVSIWRQVAAKKR